jgi:hypothetical protein
MFLEHLLEAAHVSNLLLCLPPSGTTTNIELAGLLHNLAVPFSERFRNAWR